jgi:hypothetical protein
VAEPQNGSGWEAAVVWSQIVSARKSLGAVASTEGRETNARVFESARKPRRVARAESASEACPQDARPEKTATSRPRASRSRRVKWPSGDR